MEEKHIVSFSGGKDSTAMLLKMLEKNMRIDEIIFINTQAEYPAMYEHISKVEKMINIPITKLEFKESFEFYMLKYQKKKGEHKGESYGWCGSDCRWGTTFKKEIFKKYIKENYSNVIIEYEGIAADEQERFSKNKDKKWTVKYPLVEWGITEKQALKYCYKKGFDWGGLYKYLDRVSCWCCRNKNLKELKNIYKYMPEMWTRLKNLEINIGQSYKKNSSLKDLEERFKREIYIEEHQVRMF